MSAEPRPKPPTELSQRRPAALVRNHKRRRRRLATGPASFISSSAQPGPGPAAELEGAGDADGLMSTGSTGQPTIHPALAEARQLGLVQQRLLGSIELCNPADGTRDAGSAHGGAAARARWQRAG